ncbi:hypothetical protein [Luethyella okanaganae]|uniref:Uncharacterized protein n=1 Tax=Luethyella okanaganae TaxID=69372 RepID=A0ABW1VF01_9MICO
MSGIDISVSRVGVEGQTRDVWIVPFGPADAVPFAMLAGPGGLVLSIGKLLQIEVGPHGTESRELVLDLFWANAMGGCAVYRVGWRRYFIAGDHLKLSSELRRRKLQRVRSVVQASPWALTFENRLSRRFSDGHLIHRVS